MTNRQWLESLTDNQLAAELYNAGWRKPIEVTWKLNKDGSGTCSACNFTQRGVWDYDNFQRYCGCCGAKMKLEEKQYDKQRKNTRGRTSLCQSTY